MTPDQRERAMRLRYLLEGERPCDAVLRAAQDRFRERIDFELRARGIAEAWRFGVRAPPHSLPWQRWRWPMVDLPKDEHEMVHLCSDLCGVDALCTIYEGVTAYVEVVSGHYTLTLWLGIGEAWRARLDSMPTGLEGDTGEEMSEAFDVTDENTLGFLLVRAMGHRVDTDPMGWLHARADMGVARA